MRLQARRHGAGLAVSEMVSSFGLHHRNERTLRELLRIHPRGASGSIQLFGHDPEVMRSAAAIAADAGADLIDLNMGCPVRKVRARPAPARRSCADPELALRLARAARRGLRAAGHREASVRAGARATARASSWRCGWSQEAGVAAIAIHPRSAAVQHRGTPDYGLVRELVGRLAGSTCP